MLFFVEFRPQEGFKMSILKWGRRPPASFPRPHRVPIRFSLLRPPEVKMQQRVTFWKAESLRYPVSKELAPEDTSIESYGDFESAPPAKTPPPSARISFPRRVSSNPQLPRGILPYNKRKEFLNLRLVITRSRRLTCVTTHSVMSTSPATAW